MRGWAALVGGVLLATVAGAATEGERAVLFANGSGEAIVGLFISPAGSESWEDDVLAPDVLPAGRRLRVLLAGYGPTECSFDVKATTGAGDAWVLRGVDLCRAHEIDISATEIRAH